MLVFILTFITYTFYHMSRRPPTVVKTQLVNCTEDDELTYMVVFFCNRLSNTNEPLINYKTINKESFVWTYINVSTAQNILVANAINA